MDKRVDVLGLGAVAVDDLFFVAEYPKADSKCQLLHRERRAGGLAGMALLAAARIGSKSAYAGTLGDGEHSRFIVAALEAGGVSTRQLVLREGARPFHSIIIVDTSSGSRTIISDSAGVVGADVHLPTEETIRSARVLLVDYVGLEGMVRAARIARSAGIPVVADFEREEKDPYRELFTLSDHLILPLAFAMEITGARDGPTAVLRLWGDSRSAVVVTAGGAGCWYVSREAPGEARHCPAFPIEALDTTGCGDVFHGVYASCLARGRTMEERVLRASAAAAIKAARGGGAAGLASADEVEALVRT